MPKCANGHDCGWAIVCTQCGAGVSYRQEFEQLALLPSVDVVYEQTAVLFAGLHQAGIRGAYTAEVILQEFPEITGKALALKMIAGATWLDYHREYRQEISSWLRLVAFGRSKYRIVVVDTTKFLSVLALDAVDPGTIVLALMPSKDSTPVEQNTSYVALQVALKRGLPVILATNRYVKELTFVKEGEGLITGEKALEQIIEQLVRSVRSIQDFLAVDSRLGVRVHCFSAVISASNSVYKRYEDIFEVQEFENSVETFPDEVHTVYLLGSARKDVQMVIGQAFERYTKRMQELTSAQAAMSERNDLGSHYDVLLLFGVNESLMDGLLKEGYLSVAERAGNLTAEEILR